MAECEGMRKGIEEGGKDSGNEKRGNEERGRGRMKEGGRGRGEDNIYCVCHRENKKEGKVGEAGKSKEEAMKQRGRLQGREGKRKGEGWKKLPGCHLSANFL